MRVNEGTVERLEERLLYISLRIRIKKLYNRQEIL